MNPISAMRELGVDQRRKTERYFALALAEFQSGTVRAGLMAKAISEAKGDAQIANALYLKFLADAIRDDEYLAKKQGGHSGANDSLALDVSKVASDKPASSFVRSITRIFVGFCLLAIFGYIVGGILGRVSGERDFNSVRQKSDQVAPAPLPQAPSSETSAFEEALAKYQEYYTELDPDSVDFNERVVRLFNEEVGNELKRGRTIEVALKFASISIFGSSRKYEDPRARHARQSCEENYQYSLSLIPQDTPAELMERVKAASRDDRDECIRVAKESFR